MSCFICNVNGRAIILCYISFKVLDVISPPYTTEFVQQILPLIENEDITGSLRNDDGNDYVSEFISKLPWK